MTDSHPQLFSPAQLGLLENVNRIQMIPAMPCPFCGDLGETDPLDELSEHVAEHMHEFALTTFLWPSKFHRDIEKETSGAACYNAIDSCRTEAQPRESDALPRDHHGLPQLQSAPTWKLLRIRMRNRQNLRTRLGRYALGQPWMKKRLANERSIPMLGGFDLALFSHVLLREIYFFADPSMKR
ncbi:hypothetical protein BDP55DRAFT_632428 [Colletotrichum godetiae]|uniref:Uncharacterized protein n=1 Tax=Colletotrichum godetiae TaxID=1209918 RepID=A0AAJ0AL65_9PEZI|nr:uncharacterized protein BDP55DRAFT_632428 [Colletotrichum godetiae]KAK1675260.1 hypothetical protein BDP55DRAFT_632428 [Colletotrichum godetiae]